MDRSQRTSVTPRSKWLASVAIGHRTECTQERREFGRSSGQTDLEYPICGLRDTNIRRRIERSVKNNQRTVITSARHVVPRTGFVASELVHSLVQGTLGLAELNHARLEVVKRSIHEAGLFLVMSQEVMPQRMLESM